MNTRRYYLILFGVALPTASALWAYFYTVRLPFRAVFLKHSIGPLLLWQVSSPFSLGSITLFTVLLISTLFTAAYLQRKKRSLIPFASFWHLALTPLVLSPLSGKFPEFIPLALVLLPAASAAVFLVLIFREKQEQDTPSPFPLPRGERIKVRGIEIPILQNNAPRTTFHGIFGSRLAPYTIWIITFFILLASGLYTGERIGYKSGDVKYYFTIARSMYSDHDIDMANNIRDKRKRPAPRYHISGNSAEGHAYSWHPVGLPLILAPFFDGVYDFREALVIMCIIGAFLASQMYLAAYEETGNTTTSLFAWIILAFSSPLWFYSFRAWPFVPGALCMLYAWRKISHFHENNPCKLHPHLSSTRSAKSPLNPPLVRGVGGIKDIVILNVLLAWLLWLHDSFIVCYGILGIFLLNYWMRKPRAPKTLATVIFQALNLGTFVWFHYRWFGKALSGQPPSIFTFWPGMLGTWFDYRRGVVAASPIHLLCFILIFIYAFKKRNLPGFILLALYVSGFVADTASSRHWVDPFNHPGRRLVEIIPLTCIPLSYFLVKRKNPAFCWLVAFLSLLSVSYMLFFVANPVGINKPISYLALSHQQFRIHSLHLPAFGRSFRNFPWAHVKAVTISFVLFVLAWVLLLVKESRDSIYRTLNNNGRHPPAIRRAGRCRSYNYSGRNGHRLLFTGMWMTLLWIFFSVGWMKIHFETPSPIPWNTNTNCMGKHNMCGIAYPRLEKGLYRYLVYGLDKTQEKLTWSIEIKNKLPTSLDLVKGMYRVRITGTGNPLSTGMITILDISEGKELCSFPVTVDAEGKFSHEIEINLSRTTNRIKVELNPQDEQEEQHLIFQEMTITPIPAGLEPLVSKIEEKRKPSGWLYLD
jgi:hypothetical protein